MEFTDNFKEVFLESADKLNDAHQTEDTQSVLLMGQPNGNMKIFYNGDPINIMAMLSVALDRLLVENPNISLGSINEYQKMLDKTCQDYTIGKMLRDTGNVGFPPISVNKLN